MFAAGVPLIALISLSLSSPACFAGDSAFSDLELGLVRPDQAADQACCERAIYSKSFDRWIKAYVNGHDAEAEKEWAGVLAAAKGASDLNKLAGSTYARLEFLEGDQAEKLEKRGGAMSALKTILGSTERVFGASNQVASIADYLGGQYRRLGDFPSSALYYRKSLYMREQVWGKNDNRIASILLALGENEFLVKDYASAKAHAERGLSIANKGHYVAAQHRANALLAKLAKVRIGK